MHILAQVLRWPRVLIRSHESSVASMLVTHVPLRSILIHKPIIQGLVKVPKTIPRLSSLESKKNSGWILIFWSSVSIFWGHILIFWGQIIWLFWVLITISSLKISTPWLRMSIFGLSWPPEGMVHQILATSRRNYAKFWTYRWPKKSKFAFLGSFFRSKQPV